MAARELSPGTEVETTTPRSQKGWRFRVVSVREDMVQLQRFVKSTGKFAESCTWRHVSKLVRKG